MKKNWDSKRGSDQAKVKGKWVEEAKCWPESNTHPIIPPCFFSQLQILLSLPNFPFFVPEPDREQNQGVISGHQTHSCLLFDGAIAQKKLPFTFQQPPLVNLELGSSFYMF